VLLPGRFDSWVVRRWPPVARLDWEGGLFCVVFDDWMSEHTTVFELLWTGHDYLPSCYPEVVCLSLFCFYRLGPV
jgi:hypothetical protein